MNDFLLGFLTAGFFTVASFFARFYRESRDRLFAFFALSFGILGANQVAFLLLGEVQETYTALYLVRSFAFLLIVIAIVDKNRQANGRG
jgi:hypothetical protein